MDVEPEKSDGGPGEGEGEDRQLAPAGEVEKAQVLGPVHAPDQVREDPEGRDGQRAQTGREPVQAVGDVGGVGGADDHEPG